MRRQCQFTVKRSAVPPKCAVKLSEPKQPQKEDRDDCDDHQQFDECEGFRFSHAGESAAANLACAFFHHPIQVYTVHHGDVELHIALIDFWIGSLVEPLVDFRVPIGK